MQGPFTTGIMPNRAGTGTAFTLDQIEANPAAFVTGTADNTGRSTAPGEALLVGAAGVGTAAAAYPGLTGSDAAVRASTAPRKSLLSWAAQSC